MVDRTRKLGTKKLVTAVLIVGLSMAFYGVYDVGKKAGFEEGDTAGFERGMD